MNPFHYGLCDQTVTVYRKTEAGISRSVVENCHMTVSHSAFTEAYGKSRLKPFLLIIPGNVPLLPGDRIFRGVGPEAVDWQRFLPVLIPELYEVSFAKPCFWEGETVHWEAGCRKEHL